MAKRILIVGLLPNLVDGFREQLRDLDLELVGCSTAEDVRAAFASGDFDHVFLGGGLDIEVRLAAARTIYESSDKATVHMKDHMSGPEGFVPFVRAVLRGLADYVPKLSDRAILRARR